LLRYTTLEKKTTNRKQVFNRDTLNELKNPSIQILEVLSSNAIHSGLGMDVKSVSHLYKESRSLDIARPLIRGDHTVLTTVQAKVQHDQKWTRKFAIYVLAAEIAGTILSSTEPAIGNVPVVELLLVIHDTQPQDPQPPQSPLHAPPGDLDLSLHLHPIVEPGPQPLQVEPILTQAGTVPKVSAIRQEVRRVLGCSRQQSYYAGKPLHSTAG
jgi:hypothetical protein